MGCVSGCPLVYGNDCFGGGGVVFPVSVTHVLKLFYLSSILVYHNTYYVNLMNTVYAVVIFRVYFKSIPTQL